MVKRVKHAYLLREVPGLLQQRGVQPLQFLELEDLEALMSVLGPSSLARVLDRKIKEAGADADVQQWFFDSPVAPQPTRPAIVTERMDRLFSAMVIHLGFENDSFERWKAEREGPTYAEWSHSALKADRKRTQNPRLRFELVVGTA